MYNISIDYKEDMVGLLFLYNKTKEYVSGNVCD